VLVGLRRGCGTPQLVCWAAHCLWPHSGEPEAPWVAPHRAGSCCTHGLAHQQPSGGVGEAVHALQQVARGCAIWAHMPVCPHPRALQLAAACRSMAAVEEACRRTGLLLVRVGVR
jgi:hypothetical protein